MDKDDDTYFDILGMDGETFNYIARDIKSYIHGNVIDGIIINGKRIISSTYITPKKANSFESFKSQVIDIFDLNICKNIFQISNGKNILYIHDFKKLVKRVDFIDINYVNDNEIINECLDREFYIEGELTLDPYFKYSTNRKPFLVYKNDKNGHFEKLTFLDKVMNRDDLIKCMKETNGNIILNVTKSKYNGIKDDLLFGIYFAKLFDMFLHNNFIRGNDICECELENLCGIEHEHWNGDVCRMKYDNIFISKFIIVNYENLNANMQKDYDNIFEMGNNNGEYYNYDIHVGELNTKFQKKYIENTIITDAKYNNKTYKILNKNSRKTLKNINDDEEIVVKRGNNCRIYSKKEFVFKKKKEYLTETYNCLNILTCYKAMEDTKNYYVKHFGMCWFYANGDVHEYCSDSDSDDD
jgi:hypothetical protein